MKKPKNSIPFKVVLGYLVLTAFGVITIWFIYNQTVKINTLIASQNDHKKLSLISEVAARLYVTDGISRNIIQNRGETDLSDFNASIDTISNVLDSLKTFYPQKETQSELDSIHYLLSLTGKNLEELISFRRKNASNNYYDRVLKQLEEADYLFGSTDYQTMVKDLKPYQQKVIIEYLKYAESDNADRLTNRTADSLINTMKQVLLALELNEHNYQNNIAQKEQKLLVTGVQISNQLRKIRNRIEQEEIQNSLKTVESQQEMLHSTFRILILFGAASVLTILAFVIIIVRDTNKSKQYRLDLEKAKTFAERLLKSREQLMNTVTHDLRSPISTILGYSTLLNKTTLDSKQKVYARQLDKASDYTLRLVNDLLDFSRLDSGKITVEERPFIPDKLIRETLNVNIPSENSKGLEVKVGTDAECHEAFLTDPFRLQQILANLIGNAYKFTENGGISISGKIQTEHRGKILEIQVEDTGIGISAEQQKVIFDEFSQADSNTEKRFGGTGLGLAITKKLTQLLGGDIEVESEEGSGSTFILRIPVKQTNKTEAEKTIEKLQLIGVKGQHVLLVDDDEAQLGIISELLRQQGFRITEAENGKEALHKLKKDDFNLIFTDIHMPEMTGFQFVSKVRKLKHKKYLPVIALSGAGNRKKAHYLEKGFSDYLLKPYTQNEILRVVARFLNLKLQTTAVIHQNDKTGEHTLYDLTDLKSFIGEDQESLQTILESFKTDLKGNMDRICKLELKEEEDLKQIANLAHKMLPMSRQIRAEALVKPLEILEQQIERLEKEQLKDTIDQAVKASNELLRELK